MTVAEGDEWSTWALNAAQVDTLRTEAEKYVQIRPAGRGADGRRWQLRARRTVGAVRLGAGEGTVQLHIAPKVPVDRLLFLLSYAQDRRAVWDAGPVDGAARRELFPVLARRFAELAERALGPGPLTGYRDRQATSMMLRGRLRAAAQLRRRPGVALPLEIAYDEHTTDIPENQLLLGAARRLARLPGLEPRVRARLRRIDARLDGVTAPQPGAPVAECRPTRMNARYGPALQLARLVVRGSSFEYRDGRRVRVDGLLLNMEKVYEEFLAKALGAVLERRLGGRAMAQPRRTHYLDDRRKHELLPDLVHHLPEPDGGLRPVIVADAKYQEGIRSANLYQLLAYCIRFGLSEGHLICVDRNGDGEGDATMVRIPSGGASGAIILHQHVLNLALPPPALAARLEELGSRIIHARTTAIRPRL
ncbi:McrC family protein [Streptomyces aidingensis]|uniref:McrC family protein n=1 Tax=Streptomyces aidingensis TaxID=910347 RepID=UPI0015870CAB|nr:restriction endonuclease [Streptomyces aidingensis]